MHGATVPVSPGSRVCQDAPMQRFDRATSGDLMWAGIVGPVLFVAVFLVDGAVRPGYDPVRLQVSYLSLGDRGAIQVANFIVTGLLLGAFAVGLRRRLAAAGGRGARGAPIAVGSIALGLLIAGVFSTAPAFGYPPGAPDGFPTSLPPTAYLHVVGALLFFGGLIAAPALLARGFRAQGETAWTAYSVLTALVVFVALAASSADPSGQPYLPATVGLLQRVSIVAGLAWIAALAAFAPLDA
jgi:hypothetical protein